MNLDDVAPAERATPHAIVVGHGDFASGLVSAVHAITGRADAFVAMSNTGLGPDGIERALRETVDTLALGVIFTDLPAGSCTIAARKVQRVHPGLVVVTGTNLGTILEFVMQLEMPAPEAAARAVARGKETLVMIEGPRGS